MKHLLHLDVDYKWQQEQRQPIDETFYWLANKKTEISNHVIAMLKILDCVLYVRKGKCFKGCEPHI